MALNDYICKTCDLLEENYIYKPSCPKCGQEMEVTFQNWHSLEFNARKGERTDATGAVQEFGALDDPLCMAQMGLGSEQLKSYQRTTPEQATEFVERLQKDGDSRKLRKDILRAYTKNTGSSVEVED
jgi:hypothetical protein